MNSNTSDIIRMCFKSMYTFQSIVVEYTDLHIIWSCHNPVFAGHKFCCPYRQITDLQTSDKCWKLFAATVIDHYWNHEPVKSHPHNIMYCINDFCELTVLCKLCKSCSIQEMTGLWWWKEGHGVFKSTIPTFATSSGSQPLLTSKTPVDFPKTKTLPVIHCTNN